MEENLQSDQNNPTKKVGAIFNFVAWIVGILLLVKFFGMWESKQVNPNFEPKSVNKNQAIEVILTANKMGHFVTNGYINGQKVTFLLDTGASGIGISKELAYKLRLNNDYPVKLHTANGVIDGWSTNLESVQIGKITLKKVNANISANLGDEVLLGMSALKQLEFAHKNGKLLLRQNLAD